MKKILRYLMITLFVVPMASCIDRSDKEDEYTLEKELSQTTAFINNLTQKGNKVEQTKNGVYYVITKAGEGEKIKEGDKVELYYLGYFTDGTIFDGSVYHANDDSFQDGKFLYTHKVDRMIPGWEDAIEQMQKGTKALFVVPSTMGYGISGYGTIPPYTPLVFEVEIVNVTPK